MADRRLLGAMAGLAQGLDKGATNLQNIMKASYEIKQNKELLNLKKKSIEADITQSEFDRDYKSQLLKSDLAKNAVDEKTAMREGYKTREEIRAMRQKYDFVSKINTAIEKQISGEPQGNDGKLPVENLGWSTNTGTGNITISNRGKDDDFFKRDFAIAAEAVGKIKMTDKTVEEKTALIKTVHQRLRRAYPTESNKIEDYFMAEE